MDDLKPTSQLDGGLDPAKVKHSWSLKISYHCFLFYSEEMFFLESKYDKLSLPLKRLDFICWNSLIHWYQFITSIQAKAPIYFVYGRACQAYEDYKTEHFLSRVQQ